jgi:branched-chain amino acid transport system ATP-binding protein
MTQLLSVTGLAARYGKVEALHNLNLSVEAGQIVTVIGANGAGKSTLLNALMGSLPPRAGASGGVTLDGLDISRWDVERRVNLGMSLVPEKRELFATMTVLDNLRLGAFRRYRRRERGWDDQLARVFSLFPRLAERKGQAAGTLSGGERQMLALGRALMAKPRLLMLDEPSLGLAPLIVREIFMIIAELKRAEVAVLLVEQNARAALQVADFGYVLETGECTLSGPAADLIHDPAVIESYLGLGAGAKREAAGRV